MLLGEVWVVQSFGKLCDISCALCFNVGHGSLVHMSVNFTVLLESATFDSL